MTFIAINKNNGYWHLHLSRPSRRNALGSEIATEFENILENLNDAFNADDKSSLPKMLIFTAEAIPTADRKNFVWIAGGDQTEVRHFDENAARDFALRWERILISISSLPLLTATWVDGAAIGGAAELSLAFDIRWFSSRSSLDFRHLSVGRTTGFGGASRLASLVGRAHAQNIIWCGKSLEIDALVGLGLATDICNLNTQLASALDNWAQPFLKYDPRLVAAQKQLFREDLLEHGMHRRSSIFTLI